MTKRLLTPIAVLALVLVACTADDPGGPGESSAAAGASGEAPPELTGSGISEFEAPAVDVTGDTISAIQDAGTLKCGVKFDVFAFGYENPESGDVEGMDADLCRVIAESLGVEPEFIEAISDNRIPYLEDDTVDIVISTFTINDERREQIDFSDPYYVAGQSILTMSDNEEIQGIDSLAGTTVCSVTGSTSEQNIREMAPEAEVSLFGTYTEAAQALVDGRCHAVSTDDIILFGLAERFEGTELRGEPFTQEDYGIGVKKGKEDLVEYINAVFDGIWENGSYESIFTQHVGNYVDEMATPPFAEN